MQTCSTVAVIKVELRLRVQLTNNIKDIKKEQIKIKSSSVNLAAIKTRPPVNRRAVEKSKGVNSRATLCATELSVSLHQRISLHILPEVIKFASNMSINSRSFSLPTQKMGQNSFFLLGILKNG